MLPVVLFFLFSFMRLFAFPVTEYIARKFLEKNTIFFTRRAVPVLLLQQTTIDLYEYLKKISVITSKVSVNLVPNVLGN